MGRRRLAALGGLVLGLAGVALAVALGSYHPSDASFDTAGAVVRNLAGPGGAILADLLWQGFGIVAVLPAGVMLLWGWRIAESKRLSFVLLRILALAVSMPLVAGVLATLPVSGVITGGWLSSGLGGAVGFGVGHGLVGLGADALGALGAAIVWVIELLLGLGLAAFGFGLSLGEWRTAGRHAGRGALGAANFSMRSSGQVARGMSGAGRGLGVLWRLLPDWGQAADREQARAPHPATLLPPMEPEDAPDALPPMARQATPFAPQPAAPRAPAPAVRVQPPKKRENLSPEIQPSLPLGWRFPTLSLLKEPPLRRGVGVSPEALQANARLLETVLADYGVQGSIVEIRPGPVVTLYELEPAPGIRSARVIGLADDVARSLSVTAVRIATVPGRNVIGIEVPNAKRETVFLREMLASEEWHEAQPASCRWRWARTSAARRSSPIWRACRIC